MSAKTVIITGATGFVGANLARRMLADGHSVHLLVRPGFSTWRISEIQDSVQLHEIEFSDESSLTHLVSEIRPDWIFHLAAHGAYSWQKDRRQIVETNYMGTINLVEACVASGFERFVNTGSSSEYGLKDHAPVEHDWLEPNSHYAATKAAATLYCRYTAQLHALPIQTLRLYSVYGPFEDPARLIPTLAVQGLSGNLPALADPTAARDYIHIDDVVDAFLAVATNDPAEMGAVYNVGTGSQTSLEQVVEVARKALNITPEPDWGSMAKRNWDTSTWVADRTKLSTELGWSPRIDFAQGFQSMVNWFQDRPDHLEYYRRCLNIS